MKITCKFQLIRSNRINHSRKIIFQSDSLEEIKRAKAQVESEIPKEFFDEHVFLIEENEHIPG